MPENEPNLLEALAPSDTPIAVIVCHGIGQQAPFETLNDVVNAFELAHRHEWTLQSQTSHQTNVEAPAKIGFFLTEGAPDDLLPLAQIELMRIRDKKAQTFHFFEIYWAPMTEAVVGFWDVFFFLLRAGYSGARASLRGEFLRFTFGEAHTYRILPLSGLVLAFAFFVVLSLIALIAAFCLVVGSDILDHFGFAIASHLPVEPLRSTLISTALISIWFFLPPIGNAVYQRVSMKSTGSFARFSNFIVVIPVLIILISFGVSVASILVVNGPLIWRPAAFLISRGPALATYVGAFLSWLGLPAHLLNVFGYLAFVFTGAFVVYVFRFFLVKYVGDITAYVSAHAVNRFWKVRSDIQGRALSIGKSVYGRPGESGPGKYMYDHVVLIGHSLGSVVGYDLLNTLINLDACRDPNSKQDIARRTRLFLTCGSPLNKIAFLFRFQTSGGRFPRWRELLNNFRQPLIVAHDSTHRPQRWINISCLPDWISGRLTYYELPAASSSEQPRTWMQWMRGRRPAPIGAQAHGPIHECQDKDGVIPLVAHTQYFRHQEFRTQIYEALWR
jgi:hypothetical protein